MAGLACSFPRVGKERQVIAVAIGFHLFLGNEFQRRGIDHVPFAGRRGSVLKKVSQMRVAPGGADFGSNQIVGNILFFHDAILRKRLGEIEPAVFGVEFISRAEKRIAGDDIDIDSGEIVVPVLVLKSRLGRVLSSHSILFVFEERTQLLVGRHRPLGIVRQDASDGFMRTGEKIDRSCKNDHHRYPCPNAQVRFVFLLDSPAFHAARP